MNRRRKGYDSNLLSRDKKAEITPGGLAPAVKSSDAAGVPFRDSLRPDEVELYSGGQVEATALFI
jgi:hypothetical protein